VDPHLKVLNSRAEFSSALRVGGPLKTTLPQYAYNKNLKTPKIILNLILLCELTCQCQILWNFEKKILWRRKKDFEREV